MSKAKQISKVLVIDTGLRHVPSIEQPAETKDQERIHIYWQKSAHSTPFSVFIVFFAFYIFCYLSFWESRITHKCAKTNNREKGSKETNQEKNKKN